VNFGKFAGTPKLFAGMRTRSKKYRLVIETRPHTELCVETNCHLEELDMSTALVLQWVTEV
jgi:hypothetical protein